MEVFLANGIKFLLIQDTLVPETIGLCIELRLKMTGEYRLDLTRRKICFKSMRLYLQKVTFMPAKRQKVPC
jgi:hypothetical protein